MKAYSLELEVLIIHRELTNLDIFVRDFITILKKYSPYLIVSGFVSIATGRSRGTEDVDMLIPIPNKESFFTLFSELLTNGFWCYQAEQAEDAFAYIERQDHIRFAQKDKIFPNMECIPVIPSKKAQYFELTHPQKMKIADFVFNIPPLEFEILFKEIVLKSKKDLADAKHLRTTFKDILRQEKFNEYERIIRHHD